MIKKIVCLLLCLATVFSLAACGAKDDPKPTEPKDDVVQTDPTADNKPADKETAPSKDENVNVEEYREGSVEAMAQSFIKNLIEEDYEKALRCFAVPAETPYFTAADVEWYLPRSNYADVLDVNYENYTITVEKLNGDTESADCQVIVKDKDSDKSKEFVMHMTLDKTNKWGVQDNDFYLNEYWVVAPGGDAVLTIDGVDATADVDGKFGDAKYRALYKLTYIGKSEKKFAVSSDNFDTYEEAVYPVKNEKEEPAQIKVEYADEAALDALKTMWADIYQAVLDGKQYSDLIDKLSPNADPAVMEVIMNSVNLMRRDGINYDFKVSEMSFCSDDAYMTQWLSDNKLHVCFNYTLNWVDDPGYRDPKPYTMTYYDWIILHFDGENFTIDALSKDNMFFSKADDWYNEKK